MKYILSILIVLGMLAGCGEKEEEQPETKPAPKTQPARKKTGPAKPQADLDSLSTRQLWDGYKKLREKAKRYEKSGHYQKAM